MRRGAGLVELDDSVEELPLAVGHGPDHVELVGDVREQGRGHLRKKPDQARHAPIGGAAVGGDGAHGK
jgi:hypothetical protein